MCRPVISHMVTGHGYDVSNNALQCTFTTGVIPRLINAQIRFSFYLTENITVTIMFLLQWIE